PLFMLGCDSINVHRYISRQPTNLRRRIAMNYLAEITAIPAASVWVSPRAHDRRSTLDSKLQGNTFPALPRETVAGCHPRNLAPIHILPIQPKTAREKSSISCAAAVAAKFLRPSRSHAGFPDETIVHVISKKLSHNTIPMGGMRCCICARRAHISSFL